nr:Chain C, Peptide from Protein Nef [Human immunodeficiency virus 1]
RPQVPLRPMTY